MGLTLKAIIALDGVHCRNQGTLGQGGGRRDILEQISVVPQNGTLYRYSLTLPWDFAKVRLRGFLLTYTMLVTNWKVETIWQEMFLTQQIEFQTRVSSGLLTAGYGLFPGLRYWAVIFSSWLFLLQRQWKVLCHLLTPQLDIKAETILFSVLMGWGRVN